MALITICKSCKKRSSGEEDQYPHSEGVDLRFNQIFAVSASIVIHIAAGSLLILGMFSDRHFTPELNKLNLAWVSLETGSESAITSHQGKMVERKHFPTAAIPTVSAAKIIPVQSYSVQEERGGSAASVTAVESSTTISGATAMPAA